MIIRENSNRDPCKRMPKSKNDASLCRLRRGVCADDRKWNNKNWMRNKLWYIRAEAVIFERDKCHLSCDHSYLFRHELTATRDALPIHAMRLRLSTQTLHVVCDVLWNSPSACRNAIFFGRAKTCQNIIQRCVVQHLFRVCFNCNCNWIYRLWLHSNTFISLFGFLLVLSCLFVCLFFFSLSTS